jgi:TetR/AcrR family transcriptional regulator, tetracycline repressor protein
MEAASSSRLTRQRIVEAAFGLLEREGWETLSMRRLGQELDVWPMAVYRHFRDKDELVDALVSHVVQDMTVPGARGSWRVQTRKLLAAARRTLEPLPAELRARVAPALLAPGSRLSGAAMETLTSAGFRGQRAGRAWAALGAYTAGYVELASTNPKVQFEYGLDRLLDGLEGELTEPAQPRELYEPAQTR